MKASYIFKSLLLSIAVLTFSGCTFFNEKDFDEEALVNFRGGFNINGKVTNWLGYVSFTSSGSSFTATSQASGAPSGVTITVNTPLGLSGSSADAQIRVNFNGTVSQFSNCSSNLTFDTLTAKVTVRGSVVGRRDNGEYASFLFEDSKVTVSE